MFYVLVVLHKISGEKKDIKFKVVSHLLSTTLGRNMVHNSKTISMTREYTYVWSMLWSAHLLIVLCLENHTTDGWTIFMSGGANQVKAEILYLYES